MKMITEEMTVKLQKLWGTGYIDCNQSRFIASDVGVKFNFNNKNMDLWIKESVSPTLPLETLKKVNKTIKILGWMK